MKFLFISVAIVCCIQFDYVTTNPTASQTSAKSSVIFFKATPGFTDLFLTEEQQLQGLFNELTSISGPLGVSERFCKILRPLTTDIENAITSTNTLKKDFIFLIKNIDTYASSQGTYNFPTYKVSDIVVNLQNMVSILQNIQKGLTKIRDAVSGVGYGSPAIEGTQYISGSTPNPITTQINLIGTAATDIQSFIAFLTSAPTSGANTVMDLEQFMEESLLLLGALPNFRDVIEFIVTNLTMIPF